MISPLDETIYIKNERQTISITESILLFIIIIRIIILLFSSEAIIMNWNFGLRTSNFRSPHRAFALLNIYIFVCQMESHSEYPKHTLTCLSADLMFYHYPRQ